MPKSVIPAKLVLAKAGSGNPGKHWIPGQARNDELPEIYVVMYISTGAIFLTSSATLFMIFLNPNRPGIPGPQTKGSSRITVEDVKECSFQSDLEGISQVPFLPGNSVQVLKDGLAAFQEFFQAVEKAERLICLEFYIFRDDETGWALGELLARKSLAGVRVYLIYDHFGSYSTSAKFWRFLESHRIILYPFHPPRWRNLNLYFHRDHRKLAIIDGRVFFTGGFNVGDEYRGYLRRKLKGWRDTGVKGIGPVAAGMLEAFKESWQECGGREMEENPETRKTDPEQDQGVKMLPLLSSTRKSMQILRRLLQFSLYSARQRIHLTMAYFIPSRKFLMSLIRAARKGVDVKIILPGQSDLRLISYVSRTYYQTLLAGGVKIFHYQPRVLHAKTMVFDGEWTIVGSANLDARSFNYNYECGVGILDRGLGETMEEMFRQDLLDSNPVTQEDLRRWPFHERALGTFFSRFRSYL